MSVALLLLPEDLNAITRPEVISDMSIEEPDTSPLNVLDAESVFSFRVMSPGRYGVYVNVSTVPLGVPIVDSRLSFT